MKRRFLDGSRPRLALGGLAVAAGMTLGGCSEREIQPAEFTSVAECTSAGFDAVLCEEGNRSAARDVQITAPRFGKVEDCEREWGQSNCEPLPSSEWSSGGNVFVPVMAGFVLSRAMQQRHYGRREEEDGVGGVGRFSSYRATPIYRNRMGRPVVVERDARGTRTSEVNVNTRTQARGGFGSRGSARSFGG